MAKTNPDRVIRTSTRNIYPLLKASTEQSKVSQRNKAEGVGGRQREKERLKKEVKEKLWIFH